MTRKNIELSSCSKEGCLQSIERVKAEPASRQWNLTSGGHLEAAKSRDLAKQILHNANVLHIFMNTTVMYYTCLFVSIVLNLKNIFFHVLIVVVFKCMRNTNCFTIILSCIAVSNRRCDPAAVLPFLF